VTGSALLLLLGIVLAGFGGELFVRGLVSLAAWWRVPPGIIGATVAAFATSAPELSVAVNSALEGEPEIALGDVLGSNVVNIGLVLGIALVFASIRVGRGTVVRDYAAAVAAPAVVGLLALDGQLGPIDGVVLLVIFIAWLVQSGVAARRVRDATPAVLLERSRGSVIVSLVVGLVFLIVAGRVIVTGAVGISEFLGWDSFVVGAVLVALGTSAPELATMIAARLRGHDEVAVGTILGSNIFNTLLIIGTAAVIHPISVNGFEADVGILASILLVLLIIPARGGLLARWRSIPLLGTSAVVVLLLAS
jgi:cation:H+ antiporter